MYPRVQNQQLKSHALSSTLNIAVHPTAVYGTLRKAYGHAQVNTGSAWRIMRVAISSSLHRVLAVGGIAILSIMITGSGTDEISAWRDSLVRYFPKTEIALDLMAWL
jgi:hypothetical protein